MIPNQLFNQPGNLLLFEKPLQMTKKLLSMLVFTMFIVSMSAEAQSVSSGRRTVLPFSDYLASLRGNSTLRTANSTAARVKSLVKDSQPAVYLKTGGQVNVYGDNPVSFYTDASMLTMLRNGTAPAFPKESIEIVTIKASAAQLSAGIDLSSFASFPSLKYIYIQTGENVTPQIIAGSIQNDNSAYSVFYDWTIIN